jgi:hypothetical protein
VLEDVLDDVLDDVLVVLVVEVVVVPAGCTSTAPTSQATPAGRGKSRWSVAGQPAAGPALITGLPGSGRCVSVTPPLSSRGPSCTGGLLPL